MAILNILINIDDKDLHNAVSFLCKDQEEVIEAVKKDYFLKPLIAIDFNNIASEQEKYYHANGLVAILITLQDSTPKQ